MALKQVLLGKRIEELRKQQASAQEEAVELEKRRNAWQVRSDELEAAVSEVNDETSAEDQATLEAEVNEHIAAGDELNAEETENEKKRNTLQQQIEQLQGELEELNSRAKPQPSADKPGFVMERKEGRIMDFRKFYGMTMQERDAFFGMESVKGWLSNVRSIMKEKRSITGGELNIPTEVLPLIKQRTEEASKLLKHVYVRRVGGNARQSILGTIPEAVWTQMCAKLNELEMSFTGIEIDGYKVASYIPVCNALLMDSDVALATEIIEAMGKGMGIAIDKAILYGEGGRMPVGIMTRLGNATAVNNWGGDTWTDLTESNIITVTGKTDLALFKALVEATGAIDTEYATGDIFWACNYKTKTKLTANSLGVNAAGGMVAAVNNTMPVIGGALEVLNFIPDGVIIGGFGQLYLMGERQGATFGMSEHVRFTEDETVFKGVARYDGLPVIGEAFVAIGIDTTPAADAVTFAADLANDNT